MHVITQAKTRQEPRRSFISIENASLLLFAGCICLSGCATPPPASPPPHMNTGFSGTKSQPTGELKNYNDFSDPAPLLPKAPGEQVIPPVQAPMASETSAPTEWAMLKPSIVADKSKPAQELINLFDHLISEKLSSSKESIRNSADFKSEIEKWITYFKRADESLAKQRKRLDADLDVRKQKAEATLANVRVLIEGSRPSARLVYEELMGLLKKTSNDTSFAKDKLDVLAPRIKGVVKVFEEALFIFTTTGDRMASMDVLQSATYDVITDSTNGQPSGYELASGGGELSHVTKFSGIPETILLGSHALFTVEFGGGIPPSTIEFNDTGDFAIYAYKSEIIKEGGASGIRWFCTLKPKKTGVLQCHASCQTTGGTVYLPPISTTVANPARRPGDIRAYEDAEPVIQYVRQQTDRIIAGVSSQLYVPADLGDFPGYVKRLNSFIMSEKEVVKDDSSLFQDLNLADKICMDKDADLKKGILKVSTPARKTFIEAIDKIAKTREEIAGLKQQLNVLGSRFVRLEEETSGWSVYYEIAPTVISDDDVLKGLKLIIDRANAEWLQ